MLEELLDHRHLQPLAPVLVGSDVHQSRELVRARVEHLPLGASRYRHRGEVAVKVALGQLPVGPNQPPEVRVLVDGGPQRVQEFLARVTRPA